MVGSGTRTPVHGAKTALCVPHAHLAHLLLLAPSPPLHLDDDDILHLARLARAMVAFMVRVLTHLMRAHSNELDDRRIRAIRPLIPPQVRSSPSPRLSLRRDLARRGVQHGGEVLTLRDRPQILMEDYPLSFQGAPPSSSLLTSQQRRVDSPSAQQLPQLSSTAARAARPSSRARTTASSSCVPLSFASTS